MGTELNRLKQMYGLSGSSMAQALGAMGRHGDSLVAHITPEEANLLKARGGAGTTNPLTGILEFYDADGNGNATDSSNPTGGEGSGGESSADTSAYDPGDPGFGSSVDFGGSGFSGGGFGSDPNTGGGGYYNTNVGVTASPVATTAPGTAANTATGATQANTFKFAPYTPPAPYGFELNRLMQQYGVSTPSMMPYGGMTAPTSPEENTRYEYDKTAHMNYTNQFNDRLAKGNMYNQQQFMADPTSYTPQFPNVLANPVYSPVNYTDVSNTYNKYFNRPAEEAAVKYWGDTGLKGEQLKNAIVGGAQNSDAISGIYNKYFGRPAEEAAYDYWGGFGLQGDALRRAILSGAQNSDLSYFQQNYPNYSYARGGAVKTRYAEGGGVDEDPNTRVVTAAPLPPEPAPAPAPAAAPTPAPAPVAPQRSRAENLAALFNQYAPPPANYAGELAEARRRSQTETEAFSNMIRGMSERGESPTSRAEMYFRLASAFGSPTKTGMFTENLALAGKEMGEVAKGRRADEGERRALALKAQEIRMSGAREDLATTRALASQAESERRTMARDIIKEELASGRPQSDAGKIAQDRGLTPGTPQYNEFVDNYVRTKIENGDLYRQAMLGIQEANLQLRQAAEQRQVDKAKELTPKEIELRRETEDLISGSRSALKDINRVLQINDNSFAMDAAGYAQYQALNFVGNQNPRVLNTNEIRNLLGEAAIGRLKETFGAGITNEERRALTDLQGSMAKSLPERRAIVERTKQLLESSIARQQARLQDIISGRYRRMQSETPNEEGAR
jgi:hypothetical protein